MLRVQKILYVFLAFYFLLLLSTNEFVFAEGKATGDSGVYPKIYKDNYGADKYACLSPFRVAFPNTKPGQEIYLPSIIWENNSNTSLKGGYNSIPENISGQFNQYMKAWGVPGLENQWVTYNYGTEFKPIGLYCRWEHGSERQSERPVLSGTTAGDGPPSNLSELAINQSSEIKSFWNGSLLFNVNPTFTQINHSRYAFYFLPPDLSVSKIEQSEDKKKLIVRFANNYPLAVSTKLHVAFYNAAGNQIGTETIEDHNFGSWGGYNLELSIPNGAKKVKASIGRPITDDRAAWNDIAVVFDKENVLLYGLKGENIEYGDYPYPAETVAIMHGTDSVHKDKWANNAGVFGLAEPCTDIAITDAHQMGGENGTKVNQVIGLSVTITRDDKGPDGKVPVKITLLQGKTELQSASVVLARDQGYRRTFAPTTPTKGGAVTYTFRVEITDPEVKDCDLSNNHRDCVVNIQELSGKTMEKSYYEVELVR
ncbi:MAG: hypothetical protein ACM3UZ_09885 [Acidobacteriota bacterium]